MDMSWFYKPLPKDIASQASPDISKYQVTPPPSMTVLRGELRTTPAGQNYYHWFLPADGYPRAYAAQLGLPDGTIVRGTGMDCEIYQPQIDWSTSSEGGRHFSTVCPDGGAFAGDGWFYQFFPKWSLAFCISKMQARVSDYCANRRTVSLAPYSGPFEVGFNVPAKVDEYRKTSGKIGLWVYQVYA